MNKEILVWKQIGYVVESLFYMNEKHGFCLNRTEAMVGMSPVKDKKALIDTITDLRKSETPYRVYAQMVAHTDHENRITFKKVVLEEVLKYDDD